MQATRLIIHAPNIHQGGGAVLLNALLMAIDQQIPTLLHVDARMQLPIDLPAHIHISEVKPVVWQRLLAEWHLHKITQSTDTVLCFGNLPPLFKNNGRVVVYVQNRYLVDKVSLQGFSLKIKLRIAVERLWFALRAKQVSQFVVQTSSMQRLLQNKLGKFVAVQLLPFVNKIINYQRILTSAQTANPKAYDFIYVASGEPHKNHQRLIEAWCLLAQENIRPTLCITLDSQQFTELTAWITAKKTEYNLAIDNVGFLAVEKIKELYPQTKAIIYPSLLESFGLPLIEARAAGLPVLAGELDFVRDIVDPEQTFDPHSSLSIARAVKRFLGFIESPLSLLEAKSFLQNLIIKETP